MRRPAAFGVGAALTLLLAGCVAPGPQLRDVVAPTLPSSVELAGVPFHPQAEQQCGPAALATVLEYAGTAVTPAELSPRVYLPGRDGSLQVELKAATRRFGLMPYELEPSMQALVEQLASGRPVLVLQNLGLASVPAWHFAVLVGFDVAREIFVLRSGTTERLEMSARRFVRSWELAGRWAIVVVAPGELPVGVQPARYLDAAAGLEAAGRLDAAREAYEQAVRAWPGDPLPWLGIGNIAHATGRYEEAVAAYERAVLLDDTNLTARNNLAFTLGELGCAAAARKVIAGALEQARGTSLESQIALTARQIAELDARDTSSCTR